jgi:hypothetical protein
MGMRRLRIANLLSEVSDGVLRTVLSRYGEVKDVQVETWSRLYRYPVANSIRLTMKTLAKNTFRCILLWLATEFSCHMMETYYVLWL